MLYYINKSVYEHEQSRIVQSNERACLDRCLQESVELIRSAAVGRDGFTRSSVIREAVSGFSGRSRAAMVSYDDEWDCIKQQMNSKIGLDENRLNLDE